MKKSLFDLVTISCYRYAPESIHVAIKGLGKLDLGMYRSEIGYTYVTKGYDAALIEVKKLMRKRFNIVRPDSGNRYLGVQIGSSNEFLKVQNMPINQYDIKQKLWIYKQVKRDLEKRGYQNPLIKKSETAKIDVKDGKFVAEKIGENDCSISLGRRVKLFYR